MPVANHITLYTRMIRCYHLKRTSWTPFFRRHVRCMFCVTERITSQMRSQKASRFQLFLSGHPGMANRLMGFLGPKRLARIGQRVASQAAYRAYEKVPFYQRLYEKAGVTDDQMRHLPASDFQRLPITKKKMTENVPDAD